MTVVKPQQISAALAISNATARGSTLGFRACGRAPLAQHLAQQPPGRRAWRRYVRWARGGEIYGVGFGHACMLTNRRLATFSIKPVEGA